MSDLNSALARLSEEQRRVVESWGQGMAVLAGAGSGKTTTLVTKCAELIRIKPEARFAAVSFTEKSARDLKNKLSARDGLADLSRHWVMTIHGLCGSIIKEYPREAGFDGEEAMLTEAESEIIWERAIESLWFEELPDDVFQALELLLERETRTALVGLLKRLRELNSFGVLHYLNTPESKPLQILGGYVLERYERLKKRRGAVDFNDLERGADRALEYPEVRADYQKRFDLVLVDEFQDTNPLQAKIILRFVKPEASNLCVVGDPKQSIYRFRDADVSVFEDFCRQLPVRISLTANYRSRPGIIEFTNQLCAPAFLASEMHYEPLQAKREVNPDYDPIVRLDIEDPTELGKWLRSEVDRGVPLNHFALLLRKIRGNEKWLKAFTLAGIPIAVESGGLFWDDPRVRELTSFLKWWSNPGNELSGAVFLRAPWVGVSDVTLDEWRRQDFTWQKPFFSSSHPLAEVLRKYRDREMDVRPGELLMALLHDDQIEEEIGVPLLGLWHRVEELSSLRMDFHSVVSELSLAMEENRRERTIPPPRSEGQLVVLTLHGSKGLEFPHVILIDFPDRPKRADESPLLYWDRSRGAYLAQRDHNGDRSKKDPIEQVWKEEEKRKNLAESKRLFYVALTRAEERLVLVCPTIVKDATDADGVAEEIQGDIYEGSFEKDFWRGWLELTQSDLITNGQSKKWSGSVSSKKPTKASPGKKQTESIPQPSLFDAEYMMPRPELKRPRHSVTEWTTLSRCPRAYEWKFIRPVIVAQTSKKFFEAFEDPTVEPEADHESINPLKLAQNEIGTRVHTCLEKLDAEGLYELEREVGSNRFQAEPLVQWMLQAPEMNIRFPGGGDAGVREVYPELSFEVPLQGEVLVGSIDRLIVDRMDNGQVRYSIVDFKVTSRPKSSGELLDSYETQLQLYGHALGILDPQSVGNTEARLVAISSGKVQSIPVVIDPAGVAQLIELSQEIILGKEGEPKPGKLCRFCDFKEICPQGREFANIPE